MASIAFVKRALAENPATPISWQVSRSNSFSSTFGGDSLLKINKGLSESDSVFTGRGVDGE